MNLQLVNPFRVLLAASLMGVLHNGDRNKLRYSYPLESRHWRLLFHYMHRILHYETRIWALVDWDNLAALTAVTRTIQVFNIHRLNLLMCLEKWHDISRKVFSWRSLWCHASYARLDVVVWVLLQPRWLAYPYLSLHGSHLSNFSHIMSYWWWIVGYLWCWVCLHIVDWTLKMYNRSVFFLLYIGTARHHFLVLVVGYEWA